MTIDRQVALKWDHQILGIGEAFIIVLCQSKHCLG